MSAPVLYGAAYSVYVRAARLALEEKGVPYRLEAIDIFAPGGVPHAYRLRHPFGRIPAFEHDGFRLYETRAITGYVDEAFAGRALMPDELRLRARAHQILGILDSHAYRTWVWDIYVERINRPAEGLATAEHRVAEAIPRAALCLDVIADLASGLMDGGYLFGEAPRLPDLHCAPMIAPLRIAPEGLSLLEDRPQWQAWWARMDARPSMAATRPTESGAG
jgi:glutathione S-transferase